MKKITVLGAGRVGRTIAADLAADHSVTSADFNPENLKAVSASHQVKAIQADLRNKEEILKVIHDADLVIGAVPGFMGFEMAKTVISEGKNMVDISFFNEDIFLLDELAKKNNVVAVMDCGVAPGMDNIILGYHNERMEVESFECLVGGLPVERKWPYEYKAPFSPIDVIAEYTRPSRLVRNGKIVTLPALSEPELIDFDEIGTLEAFNTDGLRSLIHTMQVPNMAERTLRYPGHINYMRVLRESGFFSEEPVRIGEQNIRPIDMTSKLLFPMWELKEKENEFTLMRVIVSGKENGKKIRITYDLLDRYDADSDTTSMSRTTGFTCTAVARLVLTGNYKRKGISAPEFVGADEYCFNFILDHQAQRNVLYRKSVNLVGV